MKKWLVAAVAIVALGLAATPARAFGIFNPDTLAVVLNWPGFDVWPPGTVFQQQIVTGYQPHVYQQQVPTVVPRMTYKLKVTKVKTYVYVSKEVDEVQRQVIYAPVARLVEQEVTTNILVPFILTGPSHLPIIACRPEARTHKIIRVVHEMQPQVKEYRMKVKRLVPEERITEYQQVVPVVTYDQALTMEWQQTLVPTQRIVTVPTFDPHHAPQLFWP